LPTQIAGEDERNQGNEDKKARDVKEPVMVKMPPHRAGRAAVAVAFIGMMMVFAHEG